MQHTSTRSHLMASSRPIIQPWDYVRLRREAAGLSIEQAASHYWKNPEQQPHVEEIVRRQEEVGYHPMECFAVEDMSRAYPFSLDVYQQLCTLPPDQHPHLCGGCGWDQWTRQTDLMGNDVRWSRRDSHLCTRCEQVAQREARG